MPRSPRIYAPGLIYHLFSRGNNREPVFFETSDYQRFLTNLERFRSPLKYTLYAYSLLPNHFHLLLKVGEVHISKIMQRIMTAYTMYINKKHDRVGHIFQGRFGSIIVEKETYLLAVQRYIHLNPVRAGLAGDPKLYPWSSFKRYFLPNRELPQINTQEILEMFSQNTSKQLKLFHEFTLEGIKEAFDPLTKQSRGILGGSKFVQNLTRVLKGVRP